MSQHPEFLDIPPLDSASGTVRLPGSKSISNRALLLAALCEGTTHLTGVLDSEDTQVMLDALAALGCTVDRISADEVRLGGLGGRLPAHLEQSEQAPLELFLGNAGTAMRPLTAVLALLDGHFTLTGVPRMYERPIADLVDALTQLGGRIRYQGNAGYPPLYIAPRVPPSTAHGEASQVVRVRGNVSSQFLTALLMAAPLAGHAVTIEVEGELISQPYIAITLDLMWRFGVHVHHNGWQRFDIAADARYRSPGQFQVEPDASSASYFMALGAIAAYGNIDGRPRCITLQGLGLDSIQGDIQFVDVVRRMGACVDGDAQHISISRGTWPLRAIDMDCNHIPDAAMTLAVLALYADGPCTLRNIASWRVKETDRIAAMANELRRLGATVRESADSISITPPALADWQRTDVHTYDDHRMAMCLSLAAFNPARQAVRIHNPACTAKTFPDYFSVFFDVVHTVGPANIPVICVDGPSASGKGTLAACIAHTLGYHLLDSGALYRVVGLAARRLGWLEADVDLAAHEDELAALAAILPLRFEGDSVWLDEEDISAAIRTEQASADASRVSALPAVRLALVDLQHRMRKLPGLVADGRDMGTMIFPDAALKIFLTASAEQRAQRRWQQLQSRGIDAKIDEILADLKARDARDTQRSVAPLKAASDALRLDNSSLDVPASVVQVMRWWQQKQGFGV